MDEKKELPPKFTIDLEAVKSKPAPVLIESPTGRGGLSSPRQQNSGGLSSPRQPNSAKPISTSKVNCLCSPTTHVGSFRCRIHRNGGMSRGSSVGSNLSEYGSRSVTGANADDE